MNVNNINNRINLTRKLLAQNDIDIDEAKMLTGLDEENANLFFKGVLEVPDGVEFIKTKLEGVWLIKPKVFSDERGFFLESYSKKKMEEKGIAEDFIQDNHSLSVEKGVLRGLHFQKPPHTQAKLVRVTKGSVFDVAVDLRKNSPTYGQWESFKLSADNFLMLYIPRGFAHGFLTLEDNTEFQYKCDNYYDKESEGGIIWNDPKLNINWPDIEPILSEKDRLHLEFEKFNPSFK
jgi:dTDP-4-dehydrorhamnose 3,5-epimerase